MNNDIFLQSIQAFPQVLLANRIKFADITGPQEIPSISDEELLKDTQIYPKKFEMDTVRYWRKMGLLPFFEQSKLAHVSVGQIMWLRFLQELKNLGAHLTTLKEATSYFIERGYRDEIARLNLVELKKKLINELDEDPENELKKITLENVEIILNDRLLRYSTQSEFNYFNLNIIDHVINGTEVLFAITSENVTNKETKNIETKLSFSVIRNHKEKKYLKTVLDNDSPKFFDFNERKLNKPAVIIPASYLVEDFFKDCTLSENSYNIQILTKTERALFNEIKTKQVKKVTLVRKQEDASSYNIDILDTHGDLDKNAIKDLKLILGTKKYLNGIATLQNGESLEFSPNIYSRDNIEKLKF
jgi:hypothetical protein